MANTKSSNYAWVVAGAGFISQMLACWGVAIWGVNLASIASGFQVQTTDLAIGASLFGLVYAGTSVFWGNLADRIGVRKVMGIGGIVGTVLLFAAGFLEFGVMGLIVLYMLSGVCLGAIGNGVTPKLISTWFSTHQRGKGFMICILGGSIGGVLIGIIAPVFINSGGWRLCFMAIGLIGIICMVLTFLFIRDSPASIGTVPYGAEKEEGVLGDQLAVDRDAKKASNADRMKRVLKMPIMWIMALVVILYQVYYTSHSTFFVASLIGYGFDVSAAGLGSSIVMAGCCIGYLVFSPLSDRFARKNVLGSLMLVSAVIYFLLFYLMQGEVSITVIYVLSFITGLSWGAFALIQSVESELFTPDLRGAGPGMISTFALIGKFGGPLVSGVVIGMLGGATFNYMILGAPCILIAGLITILTLPKTSGKYGDPIAEKYYRDKSFDSTE